MRCPFCAHEEDRVLDTRSVAGGREIRRRRECLGCARRFTTYEHIEEQQVMVVKTDQRREPFDRAKVLGGLKAACQKRPVSTATLEGVAEDIERALYNQLRREVPTAEIGEMVVEHLRRLDPVAYVRFASVYRAFQDPAQFRELVDAIATQPARKEVEPKQGDPQSRRTP
jgi:transcriptional repressor NrdR